MQVTTYFNQDCPVCGRPVCGRGLRIAVELLGQEVVCQHCRGQFLAASPADSAYSPSDSGLALLQRAEQLLATAGVRQILSTN